MDSKTIDVGSDHVLNIMSQEEQESNILGAPGRRTISEVVGSSNDLNTVTQDPEATDANANTSVESTASKRKPCRSLISENKEEYMEICVPLYEAAITGDWEAAKVILDTRPELVRFAITPSGDTTLHIAVRAEATKQGEIFMENLVKMMEIEDLEIGNEVGDPAYMIAAIKGKVHMFEVIVNKHKDLLSKFPKNTLVALDMSAVNGNHDMTLHFYNVLEKTPLSFWGEERWCIFFLNCIHGDLFDIALQVLEDHPVIGTSFKTCFDSLDVLARRPDTINRAETDAYMIWRIANSKMGNTRFVIELLRMFPTTIHERKDGGISIFHIAVMRRNKDIYNLLYETGSQNSRIARWFDNKHNNILHLVAMTSNDTAQHQTHSGASLLMQRELLWYKEVEKIVPPAYRNARNDDGKTPYELFSENNKELISKGLKWTKDCMVVATLIITVAFAVAFTVPGGYNQETGIPIFHHNAGFLVFIIADAFSLFTSSTSLLVFLSILTSPYGQRDFLYAMPVKLMIGLVSLFMSVVAMMVTFAASFFVIYKNTYKWLPILVSVCAATPVIIFAVLQYPFVMDMYRSMFDSRYLFNTGRRVLYNKNNRL